NWLESTYQSETIRALWAPWVLHAGLGPEDAFSGQIAKVIAFALEAAGAPIVKGGAQNLLAAFEALIRERGGDIRTGADVASIDQSNGRATGVLLASGETITANKSVICSVTPTQLYGRLLGADAPKADVEATRKYRYGKGNFQIHYALDKSPAWRGEGLDKVALLHLTPGLDGVSKACNEAARGMLPEVPTICVGQPHALDPSRCPEGKAVLWLQLPEAPRHIKGDAAGKLQAPADGQWTDVLREAYADRAEAILASHIEGFKDSVIARRAYSPADLEAMNINLVGGDPYGGSSTIDQSFLWRPFKSSRNHQTGIKNLYHIGASTHPGAGLGGGSGFLLAGRL
ncbi:NAD(P)/FAD-dependent oxidoreductase, partial [Mesorhizobium sp.]